MQRQRVVIAIPVLLTGGTEIQTLNLVKVLQEAGYEVIVLCYYEYEDDIVTLMREAGAEVKLLALQRRDGLLSLLSRLITTFKEYSPDIIHVQYVAPGLIPIIAARISGNAKIIATVHQPGRTHGWKAKLLLRFGAWLSNLFFCVSKSAEESWFGNSALFEAKSNNQGRCHFTLYNAVDTERIATESQSEQVVQLRTSLQLEGKKVIGYVGRLRHEKGVHVLLDALQKVVPDLPDAVLIVVGDGPDWQDLKDQAKRLKIDSNIIWLGQKSQKQVFQLYGLMDIVVMPSFFEGFGLTAAEAMAAGVPVICSKIDGLMEVVEDKTTGLFFQVGDSAKLSHCIVSLLANVEQQSQMKDDCIKRVKSNFSMTIFQKNILSAYNQMLNECNYNDG